MFAALAAPPLPIKLLAERLPGFGPIERDAVRLIIGDVPEWAADVIDFRYNAARLERQCHSQIRWIAAKVFEHGESPFTWMFVSLIERRSQNGQDHREQSRSQFALGESESGRLHISENNALLHNGHRGPKREISAARDLRIVEAAQFALNQLGNALRKMADHFSRAQGYIGVGRCQHGSMEILAPAECFHGLNECGFDHL